MKIRYIAIFVALTFALGACAQNQGDKGAAKKMTAEQMAAKKKAKAAKAAKTKALVTANTKATLSAYEKFKKDAAKKKAKAAKAAKSKALVAANTKKTKKAYAKFKMAQAKKMPSRYVIYFDFDSAAISNAARTVLKKAAYKVVNAKSTRVVVSGHTDTSGSRGYNRTLAKKRVKAVDLVLRWEGVNWLVIEPSVMGEKDTAEKTGDSVKNFQNRRVVIDVKN